jgi:SPP1 family predicted phage head-tail adaptor
MIRSLNHSLLDTLITIEQQSLSKNDIGENESSWSVFRQVNAEVEYNNSPEQFEAQQEVATTGITVKIRYDQSITPMMRLRIREETAYYYIRSTSHWRREGSTILIAVQRDNG